MINWFEIFADKLTALEEGQKELRLLLTKPNPSTDAEPFGDFHWLTGVCTGIPANTLRIKSANGEVPGTLKVGKRVLYEKAEVLNWIRSQAKTPKADAAALEDAAQAQINGQLSKTSNRKTA